jgi:hypothetical protein
MNSSVGAHAVGLQYDQQQEFLMAAFARRRISILRVRVATEQARHARVVDG